MNFHLPYINKILKLFALFAALSGFCLNGYGQAVGDYRTNATGTWNWNTTANWQRWNGTAWVAPGASGYPGQNAGTGTVTIRDNHNVTLNVSPTSNIGALTIDPGSNATALTFGAFTLNVTGDVNVNSTSNNIAKSIALNTGTMSCNNLYLTSTGGNDNRDAFVVLTSGTLNVNGNITMNAVAARTYILFNGGGTVNVRGTISGGTITSTAGGGAAAPTSGTIVYNNAGAQNVATYAYYNLGTSGSGSKAIQGNCSVDGTLTLTAGTLTIGANTLTLSNSANLSYAGGSLTGGTTSNLTIGTGTAITLNGISGGINNINTSRNITLGADLTVSGTLTLTAGTLSIAANTLTLSNGANLSYAGGSLTGGATSNLTIGTGTAITLNAISGGINNINTSRNITLGADLTVNGLFSLTAGTLSIAANTLTLSNGANLSYAGGSLTGGATSNLTIGTGTAITLNGISGGINNINTSRNITLGADLTVNGALTLTAGTFTVGANTLTLNGPTIAGTPANLATTSSSSLVFGGTSAGILIPTSVVALNNLTISNNNIVALQSSPTVIGTFTPGGGGLSIGANTLTLNGPASCGTLVGGATSSLIIGGAGAANIPAVTLNNLTLNKAAAMCGNVTVGGTLTLSSGALTVGTYTLTLNGPAIAGTPTNLITTSSSSLVFGGSSVGVSVPSSVANLNNLTVNNSAGVTMTGSVTVAGMLSMTQGNITAGTYTLIISNSAAGSLNHVSGTIIGKLTRAVNTPLSTDYIFPVGTASYYRPAVMNFSSLSAGTSITVEFISSSPAGFTAYPDDVVYLNNTFTEGYWRFFSSGLPAATYSLGLTGNGFTSYTIDGSTRITGRDNDNSTWRAMGSHGAQSGNNVSRTSITNLNTASFDFTLATGCFTTLMSYGYSRNISIDYTKVSGGADLYNFPVLIYLTGQNFLQTSPAGQILNANGYDIVFTDNNYNKLDHQLEYYNGTSGDLIAWVRIPTLFSSINTVIKILYGNPQITTDPSLNSVWDSHYKGVWHLDNNSLNDFTSFNKSGTPYNSPTYPAGRINNSIGLNGTNQYVEVINAPNTNFAGNITVSAWVYMNAANRDQKIAGNQNNSSGGYKFGVYTNNKVEFEIRNSANIPSLNRDVAGGTVLNTGQWYYLAGISSDVLDSIKTFVNGMPERPFKKTGILGVASNTLTIGKEPWIPTYYFSGSFDEIRVSDKVRSDGWMRTEYNNQSSPSTFYSLDATGVASNYITSAGICSVPITLTFGFPAGGTYSGNPYISGNVFTPPSAGTYSITYTYNGGCEPASITKDFIITPTPTAPAASNKEYCTNQIAYLEASSGVNIRWYYGGTLVSSANPFSTGQTAAGTYNYTVTQTVNGCESAATAVTLTIYSGINIITQPQPVSICAGNNASFSVAATGLNLTYQWQENGVNISNGGIYSGVTTSALTLTNPAVGMSGRTYRCVITAGCGSPVTSGTALLTITPLPVATFSFSGSPYCPNAVNPLPTFSGGGRAGVFSSTPGLVFVNTSTGEVNIAASTPETYTVYNTIAAAGGCGEVIASSQIEIISTMTWTGAVNSDWNNTGNWTCGIIPGASFSAQIPDIANEPVINSGITAEARNITIENGSSLTVASGTIMIYGSVTSNSGLDASDGTVEFAGPVAQSVGNNIFTGNTIKNLTVNNNSGVTLQGPLNVTGVVLVQSGTLASDGNLTLVSDAAQTALIDGSGAGTVTGNVTMQRHLPAGFGYKYFSSPFTGATVSEFGDDMDLASSFPLFYRFNENHMGSGWVSYATGTNILNPLAGYAVNFGDITAPKTVDVTGVVNSGNLSLTLFNHDSTYTKGFNLVGNPYPSPVDWDAPAGWTRPNIDDAVYYFKASDTDQYGGTYSSYVNGIPSEPGVGTNIIPSMQGFFVHVSDGTYPVTGTLEVNNSARINNLTHPFLKSANSTYRFLVRAAAEFTDDTASSDPSVIYFDDFAQPAFDGRLDAIKLMNTDWLVPNFYSVIAGDKKLSVNALPAQLFDTTLTVPLGLATYRDGEVRFRIRDIENLPVGINIFFRDAITGSVINMLTDPEYRVNLIAGDYNNRFSLAFLKNATGIGDHPSSDGIFSAYESSGKIKAAVYTVSGGEGVITIYDLAGRPLYIKNVYETGYYEFDPGVIQGIYIIGYTTGNQRCTLKLTIGF